MANARSILAATFGWDISEVSDYRYQRFSSPAVYAVGDRYFAVSTRKPKHDVGGEWVEDADQFFAEDCGTVLWISEQHHD